jgi:hypothetical protein
VTDTLLFVVGSFGVYYLALSISKEDIDGPWNVFNRLRGLWTEPGDWKAKGIRCIVCVACWVSLALTIGLALTGRIDPWDAPVWWLGLAGGAVFLNKVWLR